MENMNNIVCLHVRTLFCDEQTGFTIASYKTDNDAAVPDGARGKFQPLDGRTAFTAVGHRLPTVDGVEIRLTGDWTDGKYGLQLAVENSGVIRPKTIQGIVAYLSSNLVKGIGEKIARDIVDRFGVDALDIIDKEPRRLLEVPGITENKLDTIMNGFRDSAGLMDIMTELAPYGITPNKAEKILEAFGQKAIEIVKANPYALCVIPGFGFKTVDEMARKNGTPLNDSNRIAQGIIYALQQSQQSGHLFLPNDELCKNAGKLLSIKATDSTIQKVLYDLVLEKRLHEENGHIYLPKNYFAERETAKIAKSMIKPVAIKGDLDMIIARAEKDCDITRLFHF